MNSTIIRLPLSEKELTNAKRLAKEWGFSSAEDALKEILKRLLNKSNSAQNISLSKKAKTRYKQIDEDFKVGKNVYIAKNVDEFLAQLNA